MSGQLGGQVVLDRLKAVVVRAAGEVVEHAGGTSQVLASLFHGHHGVLEGGCLRVVRDRRDLLQMALHTLQDGRAEVGIGDAIEVRGFERQSAGLEQGVVSELVHGGLLIGRGLGCVGAAGKDDGGCQCGNVQVTHGGMQRCAKVGPADLSTLIGPVGWLPKG
jgi:hypothetical protein